VTDNSQTTLRTFIAVEIPAQVHALLSTVQGELREMLGDAANSVRWARPEGVHLTLQFLGDVPSGSIPAIERALRVASEYATPFSLQVGGLGAFPNPQRPRVIWVGLTGDTQSMAALNSLQETITNQMTALGFTPDKSFKPHLTLGRVRENADRSDLESIGNTLQYPDAQPAFSAAFEVNGVSLMQSELSPGGSIYTPLVHVEFEHPA
jgi:2'-5' RNA ligase